MANLIPEAKDRLERLDRHCEALEKADPSMGSYLKNFRALINELIQNSEAYTPKEFAEKYNFVRDAVVTFHFGNQEIREDHAKKR